MSFYIADCSISSISLKLQEAAKSNDKRFVHIYLKKILLLSDNFLLVKPILPQVIQFLTNSDILTRKLACWIVQNCSREDTDSVLLAVNVLVKDSCDSNPVVRAMMIKTLCSMPQSFVAEYAGPVLMQALSDSSAYVRRIAALGCGNIFRPISQADTVNDEIIDKLYAMIRDEDPLVVTNSICALDELLRKEGGVVISRTIAHYLVGRLQAFDTWSLVRVFAFIRLYHPLNDEEALDIMNMMDTYLKHHHLAVVICVLDYFIVLVQDMPHLMPDIWARASDSIMNGLGCGNNELCFQLLQFVECLFQNKSLQIPLNGNISVFFCKHSEPHWITVKKLSLLVQVATADSLEIVFNELMATAANYSTVISSESIKAIGTLLTRFTDAVTLSKYASEYAELLNRNVPHVTEAMLSALCKLDLSTLGIVDGVLHWLRSTSLELLSDNSQISVITILGMYGVAMDEAPYILEKFLDEFERKSDVFATTLLAALMRLFFVRPPQCQLMLGRLMEHCSQRQAMNVKEETLLCYSLLSTGVLVSKDVYCNAGVQSL